MPTIICEDIKQLQNSGLESKLEVALVPTMGALHEGHLSLCALAKKYADFVVVSIFVNPKQFGKNEDFSNYPREIEQDIKKLEAAGVDAVYIPKEDEIYPQNFVSQVQPAADLVGILCDQNRPGHFDGVVTVVDRLFHLIKPDIAIFGEKDYQQLAILQALAAQYHPNTKVLGGKLIREESGLAMSSRNKYLSPEERLVAPAMYKVLKKLTRFIKQEKSERYPDNLKLKANLQQARDELFSLGFKEVQYLEVRRSDNLQPVCSPFEVGEDLQAKTDYRIFAASILGDTRLIDNMEC